jgi:carbon monoxide dehydrogenase subunit G
MRKAAERSRADPESSGKAIERKETLMAMTMTGETTLPAGRPKVWAMLNDPEVLKACIPGCESLERVGDHGFAAVVKTKIGPVSATFRGKVELSDLVPLVGYKIAGEGEGGVAGFAKGGAKVSLADAEGGTLLRYDVEAHVGGKLAQLGARLVDGVAKNMADKFFANFAAAASGPAPSGAAEPQAHSIPAAVAPVEQPAARPAPTAPAPAIPTKKSWFRRISEWFMSR